MRDRTAADSRGTPYPAATARNTVLATIPVGTAPIQTVVNAAGARACNSAWVIDTATNAVTATITGLTGADFAALSPDGATLYVTTSGHKTVAVVDTVIDTIPTGAFPEDVALSAGGSQLYVANQNANTISVIDTATNTVSSNIATGQGPIGLALTFARHRNRHRRPQRPAIRRRL